MPFPTVIERTGAQSATGVAPEVTFGNPVAATSFLPMTENTMEVDPGWFSPEVMQALRDLHVYNLYGQAHYNGAIAGPFFPTDAAVLLRAAIGTDVVTGTANPWTHTISQANTLGSVTVEKNLGNYQSLQFAGCRIAKLAIKAPTQNEAVNVSYDVMGQSAAILTSPTAVSISQTDVPFVFAEGAVTLGGNARADCGSVQINIDNGMKETYTFSGNHGPSFITPVTLHVSGSLSVVFSSLNDATYGDYTTMVNGTLGALSFSATHPGATGAQLQITCPQVALTKVGHEVKMGDVIMANLSFEASRSFVSGYTIQAILKNSVSTAY